MGANTPLKSSRKIVPHIYDTEVRELLKRVKVRALIEAYPHISHNEIVTRLPKLNDNNIDKG